MGLVKPLIKDTSKNRGTNSEPKKSRTKDSI